MPRSQNADEEVVGTKTEQLKLNSTEYMGRLEAHTRFKPKPGSLIPARRRLVKTLMLHYILQLGSSSTSKACNAGNRSSEMASIELSSSNRPEQSNRVYPYPLERGNYWQDWGHRLACSFLHFKVGHVFFLCFSALCVSHTEIIIYTDIVLRSVIKFLFCYGLFCSALFVCRSNSQTHESHRKLAPRATTRHHAPGFYSRVSGRHFIGRGRPNLHVKRNHPCRRLRSEFYYSFAVFRVGSISDPLFFREGKGNEEKALLLFLNKIKKKTIGCV